MSGALTNYHWNDLDQLVEQDGANGTLLFYHDDKGDIGAVVFNGAKYSFRRNAQGDVTAILDLANNVVAKYTYDAWGKVLSVTDANGNAITAPNHIANVNPIRYRGYYYDTETGLYYLNSRYYDPITCRMLNADDEDTLTATPKDLTDKNLYSYCDSNPVVRADDGGDFWNIIIGAVGGAAFSVGWQMIVEHKSIKRINWYDVGSSAISGGLAASGLNLWWQVGFNAALGGITSAASGGDRLDIGVSTVLGGLSGWIGGRGANYKGALRNAIRQSRTRIKGRATTLAKKAAKRLATRTRKIGKRAVKKIRKSATRKYALGSSAARLGYYGHNYRRRGRAY